MKKRILKSLSIAILAATPSILFLACSSAAAPAGTNVPAAGPTMEHVPTAVFAAASPTTGPKATLAPAPVTTAMATSVPAATLAPVPDFSATATSVPAATLAPISGPTATPGVGPSAAATNFSPDLVRLPAVGSSTTITVETIGVDSGAQSVQVNVQHPAGLQVSSPACAGLFTGATHLGPAPVTGGTAIGCVLLSGFVTGATGPVITFEITRIEDFTTDQVVTFGVGGPLGTNYSENGITMDPGPTNRLIVRPSSQ
jgi:hypothetical protein